MLYHTVTGISQSSRNNGCHALSWRGYSHTASGSYGLRAPACEIEIDKGNTGHILKLIVPGGGCIYDERDHKIRGFAAHFQGTEVSDF